MAKWFFVEKGKPRGPLSEKEMILATKEGKIGPLDLLFQEGSDRWIPARDVDWLKSIFFEFAEDPEKILQWVVLKKKPRQEGAGYFQSGPHSTEQIIRKIETGELEFTDFVWRDGEEKWRKIGEVREFNSPQEDVRAFENDKPPGFPLSVQIDEKNGDELLKNVLKLKKPLVESSSSSDFLNTTDSIDSAENATEEKKDKFHDEITPVTITLSENSILNSNEREEFLKEREEKNVVKVTPTDRQLSAPVVVKKENFSDEAKSAFKRWTPSLSVSFFLVVIFLTLLGTGSWLVYSSFPIIQQQTVGEKKKRDKDQSDRTAMRQQEDETKGKIFNNQKDQEIKLEKTEVKLESTTSIKSSPPALKVEENNSVDAEKSTSIKTSDHNSPSSNQKEIPKVPVEKKPSFIKIQTADWKDKTRARLIFLTDGSYHFPLKVSIEGKVGQILDRPSYQRQWLIRVKPGEERNLLLASLHIGSGTYRVSASFEGVSQVTTIFVGAKDNQFQMALERQKKKIAYRHQKEKKRLYQLSEKLIQLTKELENSAETLSQRPSEWNLFYRSFYQRIKSFAFPELSNSLMKAKNIYYEEWSQLSDFKNELVLTAEKVQSSMIGKKNVSEIKNVEKLVTDVKNFSRQIREMNLWSNK